MWFSFFITWEQRKLGKEVEITMGQSPDGSTYRETPAKYILVQGNADLKDGWVFPRVWTTQKTKTAEAGDLIMSVRAPAGAMGKTAYNVVLGRGVAAIKGNEFIFQALVKMDSDGYWKKLAAGSTFESINSDTVSNAVIYVPQENNEQCKLGEYFNSLDNLITLHQRKGKCRFYQVLWKILSSKMTIYWEQRKVQDVAERYDNLRVPVAANLRVHGNIPYYGANGIQDYVDGFTHDGEFVLVAEDGANDLKNYPVQHVKGRIWVNNHAHVLQGKSNLMDNLFLAYSLHCADMASYLVGGSRAKLNADTLMTLELLLPSVVEQAKIGRLLDSIDNLITLHQRKQNIMLTFKKCHFYVSVWQHKTTTWEQRKFGEVFTYERPDRYIVASDKYSDYYSTPVLTANKGFILGYTNEQRTYNHPCVIFDDFTLDSKYVDFPFMVKSSALKILTAKQGYYLPFAYELLHAANIEVLGHARHYISVVQPTAVLVPNYPEQLRIGKFIEAIDNLITLHQRGKKHIGEIKNDKRNKTE